MHSILEQAKELTEDVLTGGSIAVDATVGNGYDTVHLARCVSSNGHVFGVDIQEEAVSCARDRLSRAGVLEQTTLVRGDHAELAALLPNDLAGRVGAVMFNLGYLPGGDHGLTTRPKSTVAALEAALRLLRSGGRISVVVYSGHPGGAAEREAVFDWASGLDQDEVEVLHYHFINQANDPPELLGLQKL